VADQSKRGGMKQGREKEPGGKKKRGVRQGSTATAKERGNKGPRKGQVSPGSRPARSIQKQTGAKTANKTAEGPPAGAVSTGNERGRTQGLKKATQGGQAKR
jgi:hypothetical protein